jgi:site-specific DNA recombinase
MALLRKRRGWEGMAGNGKRAAGPRAAAIYCRISDDRAGQALGVQRQEQDGRALAERRGWPVAGVYIDNDRSAYSGKPREEYERLLTDIETGAIDGVIAYQLDRLYRRPVELEHFITLADAHGVHLATVAGDIDLSTAQGRSFARTLGNAAAYESEIKGERIRRMHEQLAEAGKLSGGGSRPLGFEDDRVTVRESEAALIRTAARRVLAGDSMRSIVNEWNENGIRTSYGRLWQKHGDRDGRPRCHWRRLRPRGVAPSAGPPRPR